MNTDTPLAKELETYQKILPTIMTDEGKYALVFGDELLGVFADYEEALKAGYAKAKLAPFLVKKISGAESIAYFSREIDGACHTSPSQ
jgi:hypothetical protein